MANNIDNAARDVVERSRYGDQIAMAIIVEVRKNARRGNRRAKQSLRAIERYIKKHPPPRLNYDANMGRDARRAHPSSIIPPEGKEAGEWLWIVPEPEVIVQNLPLVSFWGGAVSLCHGPRLNDARLTAILGAAPESARDIMKKGIRFWKRKVPTELSDNTRALQWWTGRVLGLARCLQCLQLPGVPIASLCPVAAWELGE